MQTKNLDVNQIYGADHVANEQEQEAEALLTPTVPPVKTAEAEQQYEQPTTEDLQRAEQLTERVTPLTSSQDKQPTRTELQQNANKYMSQPDQDQGTYDATKVRQKAERAQAASDDSDDNEQNPHAGEDIAEKSNRS